MPAGGVAAGASSGPQSAAAAVPSSGPQAGAASCSGCGVALDGVSRFCKFCGTPVPQSRPNPSREARPVEARVVVILRDGTEGGVYPLTAVTTDIGGREGDIVLRDDPYLAPRHARIERRGDTFVLQDLGSANGVYVRIRHPEPLSDADMLLIGQQVLRFEKMSEAQSPVGPAQQQGTMIFGTPETPRLARLAQYTTEGRERDVYYLYREETVLGREQADIVFSDDPFLSRRHAVIDAHNQGFVLRDMGSSNGTYLRCRGEITLSPGEQFRLGRHLLRFDRNSGGAAGA